MISKTPCVFSRISFWGWRRRQRNRAISSTFVQFTFPPIIMEVEHGCISNISFLSFRVISTEPWLCCRVPKGGVQGGGVTGEDWGTLGKIREPPPLGTPPLNNPIIMGERVVRMEVHLLGQLSGCYGFAFIRSSCDLIHRWLPLFPRKLTNVPFQKGAKKKRKVSTRWAPTSHKWSYNP